MKRLFCTLLLGTTILTVSCNVNKENLANEEVQKNILEMNNTFEELNNKLEEMEQIETLEKLIDKYLELRNQCINNLGAENNE